MGPWALSVPLVVASTVGLLLNAYVLLIVLSLGKQTQQQQTGNTLLLIHLGAVEAAVCLVLLIFSTGTWPAAGPGCVLHGFLLALLHPVALWTVTGLNCERYYAISAPLHYTALVSPRRVALGLAISWTGALLLCLPPFSGFVPPYRYVPGLGCCAPDFGQPGWGSAGALYGLVYALLGLLLPALLVTVCNLRVLGIARYHRHRIASAIYEVTLSAQVTITHQRNPFFVPTVTAPAAGGPPKFHSAASTVLQLVGSLYLLYVPYCGAILWEVCSGEAAASAGGLAGLLFQGHHSSSSASNFHHYYQQQQQQQQQQAVQHLVSATIGGSGAGRAAGGGPSPRLTSWASLLLACSPPINGFLYGLKSQLLRRSVQNYWRKKATQSELQQEIQARTPSAAGSRRPSASGPAAAASTSFFPFPPLQRRLSEALLALGNCRAAVGAFGSGGVFQRGRLQTAASCNTLRVPNAELVESGVRPVRSSASAASLMMGPHYRNDFGCGDGTGTIVAPSPKRSPRIMITRAYSEESQDGGGGGGSPLLRRNFVAPISLPPCERRKWRQRGNDNDNTGEVNSSSGVWTTGVQSTKPSVQRGSTNGCTTSQASSNAWPGGARRFVRVRTLEEGAAIFSVLPTRDSLACHADERTRNNSESSDTTTDTTTSITLVANPNFNAEFEQEFAACYEDAIKSELDEGGKDVDKDCSTPEAEEQQTSPNLSNWSYTDDMENSGLDDMRDSNDEGLVMHHIESILEISQEGEEDEEEEIVVANHKTVSEQSRRKSRIVRETEVASSTDHKEAANQLRPLLTSTS
ncbi:uncharacterized protein LOC106650114 [Trichogramma pretiosum]|uniref:uncharacterized protein LOC106650114 n=1 Tax=Trichogramma pretiosum TaxID=7493 RepID=UPI000C7199B8|nr:uncharacterized protein LOC106650114 [Trichogramma pretiosum]